MPDLNKLSSYLFSDQSATKPLPFGEAHIFVALIRECPPPPRAMLARTPVLWCKVLEVQESKQDFAGREEEILLLG